MTRPGPDGGSADHCALLSGEPACRCAAAAPALTEQQIADRAVEKLRWSQRADPDRRAAALRGVDELLDHARAERSPALRRDLLRTAIMIRVLAGERALAAEAAALVEEYSADADRDGDQRDLGEAAVLRAFHATVFGDGQAALADTGTALALLSELDRPEPGEDPQEWARATSRSLNGLVLVLLALGTHELADEMSRRAIAVLDTAGTATDRLVHQLNRVRLHLTWALRLERGGQDVAAGARFGAAARTARTAGRLWATVFPPDPDEPLAPADECSVIGAALALRRPGRQHLSRLFGLRAQARFDEDRMLLAIATARCLVAADRTPAAVTELGRVRDALHERAVDPPLVLDLHREYARVAALADPTRTDPVASYVTALEGELWALREARLQALRGQREHHRLSRRHGAVAAQALQDPLTGLPNRRALDRTLAELASPRNSRPCAVALLDLDRFKDVNDAHSHATGDAVLRAVAGCLRATLRAQDLVARYGGDEFVVVMPATPLRVAQAALIRAAAAVAALPTDAAAGVTVSVGVVTMRGGTSPAAALGTADEAMYRAKRAGGNAVVCGRAADPVPVPQH